MSRVTVTCDRCGKQVEGLRTDVATGGFYDTTPPSHWARYANPGESIVCDACMWADPRYIEAYGARS